MSHLLTLFSGKSVPTVAPNLYSNFSTTTASSVTLGADAKAGKLNVAVRGSTDGTKKYLTNMTVTSTSADTLSSSTMALNWTGGEGRSVGGISDEIVGSNFKGTQYWNSAPRAVLTFDDGFLSVNTLAYQYMKTKGIKGTAYLVPTFLNTTGYMTDAQVQELYDNGWCLANHTYTHPNMGAYTYQQAYDEISQTKNWLNTRGYTSGARHIAFPNGAFNADVLQVCRDLGLTTARQVGNQLNNNFSLTDSLLLVAPITCGLGGGSPNFATVKTQIDNAVAQGKTCIMMFHRIVNSSGEGGTSTTDGMNFVYSEFTQVMDYLITKGLITETIDEWYNRISGEMNSYNASLQTMEFNTSFSEIRRTGKITLNGSLAWTAPAAFQTTLYRSSVVAWQTANPDVSKDAGSNHMQWNDVWDFQTVDFVDASNTSNYQIAVHSSGTLYISLNKAWADAQTTPLNTQANLKAWLDAHPITMIHEKVTTVTNPITPTITTNGSADTSLRGFGQGTVLTVAPTGTSATPIVQESHRIN